MPTKRTYQGALTETQDAGAAGSKPATKPQAYPVQIKAVKALQAVIKAYRKTRSLDLQPLKLVTAAIVTDIVPGGRSLCSFIKTRTNKNCIYNHSVNVCITAVWIAVQLKYDEEKLRELALGALLHDIGRMVVTDDVLIRGGGLPADGSKALWRHSQQGFDILRKTNDIAADAAQIALQHHLRFDGRGFPGAVKGKAIHEYARITVIADFFGYMISDSRYRRGLLPNEAGEILQIFADTIVDGEILGLFLKHCKLDSSSA